MIIQKIHRKLYKAMHPVMGEIWALHRVVEHRSDNPDVRCLEVTPTWLEEQLLDRQRKGYRFVALGEWEHKRKWICVTFDDGYHDTYSLARPLLQRLGIPYTVYVTTNYVDNRQDMWWYPGQQLALSTEELRDLAADPLCTLGAHTVTHARLDKLGHDAQSHELRQSKHELERMAGIPISHVSFPHGAYNHDTLTICHELNFTTAATSWGGPLRRGTDPWPLPRIDIQQP